MAAEREATGAAVLTAVERVLGSGQFVLGPEVEAFEREFAELHGCDHAVGVSSGTDALVLSLLACGVKPGDSVVTSPFTFFASAAAIAWIGARPRFADIDPDTALLRADLTEAAFDAKTTCVMPVHLYGQLCDPTEWRELADRRRVALVEDAAQAHLAQRDGHGPGALGDAAGFSFYPTKNLGAAGEAGLILTRSEATAKALRLLRDHGAEKKYFHDELGTNSRMHAIQAAVLRAKLPHLAAWTDRRRAIAAGYDAAFASSEGVRPLDVTGLSSYHQYAVRLPDGETRDRVLTQLRERGIHCGIHYPTPVHLQPAARDWGYGPGDLPAAESLAATVLCLPVHPFLADGDVQRVCEGLIDLAS